MTLLEEIQAKCPADMIARRDDFTITQTVNAGRVRQGSVTRNQFAIWTGQTGMRAVIEDHATDKASPLRSIALLCRDLLQGGPDTLELSNPANIAMLQAWVDAGALSTANRDALIALGEVPDPVSIDDVSRALNAAGIGV